MARNTAFGAIRRALTHPNYRVFAAGGMVSNIGTWVQRVAVGWLTWELTHSPFWLGIVAFADLFPIVILAPLAGAVTDRVDQLAMLKIAQALALLQSAVLAALIASGQITMELLVVLTFIYGVIISFNQPARLTVVPMLVPREDLSAAIAINSLIFNVARFVGPALAGIIIVAWGVWPAVALNAITYLAMLAALAKLRLPPLRLSEAPRPVAELPQEILGGWRYVLRHRGIGPLLIVQVVVSICARPYTELLPGFAEQVFGRGAEGLAWLTSATGIGAALGGLWLASRGRITGLTAISVTSAAIFALSVLGFAITDNFAIALGCTAVAGFAMVTIGVAQQTLIQSAVEPAMRGRVVALFGMIVRGAPALGALAVGAASSYVGLQWAVGVGAALALLAWAWVRGRQQSIADALEDERRA